MANQAKHINWTKCRQAGATFEASAQNDKATAMIPWSDEKKGWMGRVPDFYSAHPDYSGMALIKIEQTDEEGDVVNIRLHYESWEGQFGKGETKRYELEDSTSEEHILSHPRYTGLADDEQKALLNIANGTEADEGGQLYASRVKSPRGLECLGKIRKGITHYLTAGVTWVERFTTFSLGAVSLNQVGHIDTPSGGPPSVADGRNWLYTGARCNMTADGRAYEVERQWRLSGRGGWDAELYGSGS